MTKSLRQGQQSLEITSFWLRTHFGIGQKILADAIDEVMSWGNELDFASGPPVDGLWIDQDLFNKLITNTKLRGTLQTDQCQWVRQLLATKHSITKAISIRQPWAWLIVNGFKDIENRTWYTHYRGPVFIHAGKTIKRDEYTEAQELFAEIAPNHHLPPPDALDRGGFVGSAEITGCVRESLSPWFFGRYGFELRNQQPMQLIPHKGQLGLFNVPDRVLWEVGGAV